MRSIHSALTGGMVLAGLLAFPADGRAQAAPPAGGQPAPAAPAAQPDPAQPDPAAA